VEPIAAPGLRGHRLVLEPAGVLGTPMRGLGMRVAQAWATRDPSLLSADTVIGPAPRLVAYRDVRERVARLAPVLVQGDEVQPILHDGALLWALNLYSASAHYPLSRRLMLVGEGRSYFHFAATALVDASTGRVRIVPVDRPDAVAQSWFNRIPSLLVRARELPGSLLDQLPTASEGAMAQALTFARFGSRLEGAVQRHVVDSATMRGVPPTHLTGTALSPLPSWSLPLLDDGDRLGGVITAVGGRFRTTYWDSTTVPRARWAEMTERMRAALDTARAFVPEGSRREPRIRMGPVQVFAGENGPILLQTLIWNRVDGAPFVTRVAVMSEARVALGDDVAAAVAMLRGGAGAPSRPIDWPPMTADSRDERVTKLYEVMRDAMRRGDWTRFGAAFDSLGVVLGRSR
jgi:uncharacterized membrane protein (UPF0182 family)